MTALLSVSNLQAWYGESHVLHGVNLHVNEGEMICILGRNGMGKTTTLRTIMGILRKRTGEITFAGKNMMGAPLHHTARAGLGFIPEERGIFATLTVEENLMLGQRKSSPWQLDDIYKIFPRLKERRTNGGGQLSGGEQQMLAIGRALMNAPRLLMLDEPVEGLAPVIVEEIVAQLKVIKAAGVSIVLVEQNLEVCTQLADRHYIIEQGSVVHEATNAEFIADEAVKDRYLGVGMA